MKSIYIVIPVFNESGRLSKLIRELRVSKYQNIVLVDDGSDKNYKLKIINYKLLRHMVNLGKGAAMKTGAEYAFSQGAGAVIFMDSDGQHKVSDLPKFIAKLKEGDEVVFGSRNFHMGVPMVRFLGNKVASIVVSLLFGIYVSDLLCGFRAMTRKAYQKIKWESQGYAVETEMAINVAKKRVRYCEVPVKAVYYSSVKGVTLLDAFEILFSVIKWRLTK